MRSRPRDLAADSENRLQSARGRASATRRRGWRSRGARNRRAARARLAAPPSAALWRSESVWRPIRGARGSRIGTDASASRLIDLTLASPRDPELCRRPLQQTRSGVGAGILRSASASPVCAESEQYCAHVLADPWSKRNSAALSSGFRSSPNQQTSAPLPDRSNSDILGNDGNCRLGVGTVCLGLHGWRAPGLFESLAASDICKVRLRRPWPRHPC